MKNTRLKDPESVEWIRTITLLVVYYYLFSYCRQFEQSNNVATANRELLSSSRLRYSLKSFAVAIVAIFVRQFGTDGRRSEAQANSSAWSALLIPFRFAAAGFARQNRDLSFDVAIFSSLDRRDLGHCCDLSSAAGKVPARSSTFHHGLVSWQQPASGNLKFVCGR